MRGLAERASTFLESLCTCNRVQDLTIEDRVSRTQYQFTLEDPDQEELSIWVPRLVVAPGDLTAADGRRQ